MKKCLSICCLMIFLMLLVNLAQWDNNGNEDMRQEQAQQQATIKRQTVYLGSDGYLDQLLSEEDKKMLIDAFSIQEEEVHSFLQGPRSWEEGRPWSGEWCTFLVNGNSFGGFGCGLCCMANIYNTMSPYEVSPWDMCEFAMSVSDYAPNAQMGAIDWKEMNNVLRSCGMTCNLYRKPKTYREFQKQMEWMETAIVLINRKEDDAYWQDTPGHYVNIWLYQEEDDTVFLAEPGSPENNRQRIPLRYVYDALKTISKYQYLAVEEYQEQNNQWKADGIDELWNAP